MSRLPVWILTLSTVALTGCTQRLWRMIIAAHVVLLVGTAALSIAGLFALRSTLRNLRAPERAARAAMGAIGSLLTLALPAYLVGVYGDRSEAITNVGAIVMAAFTLWMGVLFVLAIVHAVQA